MYISGSICTGLSPSDIFPSFEWTVKQQTLSMQALAVFSPMLNADADLETRVNGIQIKALQGVRLPESSAEWELVKRVLTSVGDWLKFETCPDAFLKDHQLVTLEAQDWQDNRTKREGQSAWLSVFQGCTLAACWRHSLAQCRAIFKQEFSLSMILFRIVIFLIFRVGRTEQEGVFSVPPSQQTPRASKLDLPNNFRVSW